MQQPGVTSTRRIMLAGGGTAGHVTPLLAVLAALEHRVPNLRATWVGSDRIESRLAPAAGIDFRHIDIRFSYRPPTWRNIPYYYKHILPLAFGLPFRQGLAAVDGLQPGLVIATGGYVAAPVIWAALHRGVQVALLEINDPPGLTNWFFASRTWRVYCATSEIASRFAVRCSQSKVKVTGYPAMQPQRTRSRVCQELHVDPARRILVAMGGSLGAGAIHHAVGEFLAAATHDPDPRWTQLALLSVAGERNELRDSTATPPSAKCPVQHVAVDYIDDVPGVLAAADFYLGRSGAATVGELIASGLPALLIPDPQHGDRQQYGNATVLTSRGQGRLVEQQAITGKAILDWLRAAWDTPKFPPPHPLPAEIIADDLLTAWGDA
jgi:UDP-N-acetylglucosamine--N-acetylmuramyl-(pentapeptide) pyrophosphoryl-undecaprenol N-acetylglucosamine transferase